MRVGLASSATGSASARPNRSCRWCSNSASRFNLQGEGCRRETQARSSRKRKAGALEGRAGRSGRERLMQYCKQSWTSTAMALSMSDHETRFIKATVCLLAGVRQGRGSGPSVRVAWPPRQLTPAGAAAHTKTRSPSWLPFGRGASAHEFPAAIDLELFQ